MNLFISSFKYRKCSNLITLVVFSAGFIMAITILGNLFEAIHNLNIKDQFYPKMRWEEFYNIKEKSIDLIFLGSSHAYRSFDPFIFDKELNITSFNLGSSSQKPETGYYVLQECLNYQHPKLIIYEIYWGVLTDDHNIVQAIYNYDFIKDKKIKKEFFNDVFSFRDKLEYHIKILRYRKDIAAYFNNWIQRVLGKNTEDDKREYYKGKGFVHNNSSVSKDEINNDFVNKGIKKLGSKQMSFLEKTIELCKKKSINILFITAPIHPRSFNMLKDYETVHNNIQEFANKYDVPYFDYNYINQDENLFNNQCFTDDDHLNYQGVFVFNNHFIRNQKELLEKYLR